MTLDEYARAVAEAVRFECETVAAERWQPMPFLRGDGQLDGIIATVPKPTWTPSKYTKAVAEAVRDAYVREVSRGNADYAYFRAQGVDLDAVIASVPKPPEPQHHAAPTCDSFEWMQFQNLLWDEINRYAISCGGDPSDHVYGNTSRQQAVASVNDAVRDFVCPPDTTTPAPDVQAQDWWITLRAKLVEVEWAITDKGDKLAGLIREMRDLIEELPKHTDVQAQIDAAVADCERRCATQLADHISRAADDERVRIDAAVAKERKDCAADVPMFWSDPLLEPLIEHLGPDGGATLKRAVEALLRGIQDRIRARSGGKE